MRNLRVLHLASFNGNVGDNANHSGFYKALSKNDEFRFAITELEIREFYWKQRFFDDDFIDYVNRYDLLIIGGGNYFELWVEHSPTGTSIMIAPELFKKIRVPVVFNALGVDPGQGASKICCTRFREFLDIVLSDSKNFISIRNDGSKEALAQFIGADYLEKIFWTPDAGVNVETESDFLGINKKYMAINVAGDMIEKRFPDKSEYDNFVNKFSNMLSQVLNNSLVEEIVFIPHIYRDIEYINDILMVMPDQIRRNFITVAPLLHGGGAEKKIFSIYEYAEITLAMRFHANLCSIAKSVPTIGLKNYRQIQKLYEELGLTEYLVDVNSENFEEVLYAKIYSLISMNKRQVFKRVSMEMKRQYQVYMEELNSFLVNNLRAQGLK